MKRYLGLLAILFSNSPAHVAEIPRTNYRIETVAGSSLMGEGGPAVAAELGNIQGIALDTRGNLYLSDTDRNIVRKVDPDGFITTFAGTGVAGFDGDGGPAADAHLNLPYGLAADRHGNLYIADLGNNRIRRIGADGIITTIAGTGERGLAGDNCPALSAQLASPRNLALDASGNVYFSEFEGHRVRKILPDGRIVTIAGTGSAGFRGDGGPAAIAQLAFPAGIAIDLSGSLYIADSQNQRIRKVAPGGLIATVVGGSSGTVLYTPLAVAVDSLGTILIGDGSNTVRARTLTGNWSTVAGTGAPGFSGDGGAAVTSPLDPVRDLALDSSARLYIATGVRVRRVDRAGAIDTVAGDGYVRYIGDGASALAAQLSSPSAVALDYSGNLYIADTGTQRVRQVAPNGAIRTLAGTGLPSASGLNMPMGVAVDAAGVVLIADSYNHRIRAVTSDGAVSTLAGTGSSGTGAGSAVWTQTALRGPRGVCADRKGVSYIVDTANSRVLRAAPGTALAALTAEGQLNQPSACAADSSGNLFIADTLHHQIRKVSADGALSTVAGSGTAGAEGDNGPAASAALNAPRGVAVDDNGNVFIADTGNHVVRQVTSDGVIHLIAGQYAPGFGGDAGTATEAHLNSPEGLVLDGAGDLYIADAGNNRIRRLVPSAGEADPIVAAAPVSVVSAASLEEGPVAPGEIVTILGTGLGPETGATSAFDESGRVPTTLAGVEARLDGIAMPVFYVQAGQINAQIPYNANGLHAKLEVKYEGRLVGAAEVEVVYAAPSIFPALLNEDGSLNQEAEPAPRGSTVTLYATGEGLRLGTNLDGVAPTDSPKPAQTVRVSIGGTDAEVLFGAAAPGLVGVLQVNARIPVGLPLPGKQPLRLEVGDAVSPDAAIWVR